MQREYKRLVPEAKTAVLFMHGIVGTPEHFTKIVDLLSLVPEGISFHNLCYPGHGGSSLDFGRSSMEAWKVYTRMAFDALCDTHEQIILVGHSMGTLFAIELANSRPDKVAFLYLLQCPLRVGLRLYGVKNLLRIPFGKISPEDPYGSGMLAACGVAITGNIFLYASWIPRLLELFREMRRTQHVLEKISVPCYAFQSRKDEMVSNWSAVMLKNSNRVEVTELEHSSHFFYAPCDYEIIVNAFEELIKNPLLI